MLFNYYFLGNFPKKSFNHGGKSFGYTSYLNFTKSKSVVEKNEKIQFTCIFCERSIVAVLGKTANVKTHLIEHREVDNLSDWFQAYDTISSTPKNKFLIDKETMKIVKYFIASNSAASNFDMGYFRDLFSNYKIQIPCSKTFSKVILENVFWKVIFLYLK